MHMIMKTMAESYTIAFIVITILMVAFLSSIKLGLISLIPNIMPILLTIGIMGWISIPLDMANMLLGTVAIGLAVDDTIHFLHNFRKYLDQTGNTREAVRQTMLTTGRAMVFTTVILVTGFCMFVFSAFPPLFTFGLAIGVTLFTALLADILLVPAIMTILIRFRRL